MSAHDKICGAIDQYRDTAVRISRQIHSKPELKFEEKFAAGLLTSALEGLGLEVERGTGGMPTAFRASVRGAGPHVAILAEYDALPNGHSCGHNLIAAAALAATVGLVRNREILPGTITILGSPAEEGGAGKLRLIEAGAFKGIDAAMMVHPTNHDYSTINALACNHFKLTFEGRAAHAAGAPWAGASALSALIQTFQSVDAARLHFKDGSRLHGIITNGGQAVNIIPALTACEFLARAPKSAYAAELAARVMRCAEAAALATGTTVKREALPATYKDVVNNLSMASRYQSHGIALGVQVAQSSSETIGGSTDMGDVSYVVPTIHPTFKIADPGQGNCHEDAFVQHANSDRGYDAMIKVAKMMALTAYDLLAEPTLLEAAKAEFSANRDLAQR
jgi:amidohydrolase